MSESIRADKVEKLEDKIACKEEIFNETFNKISEKLKS